MHFVKMKALTFRLVNTVVQNSSPSLPRDANIKNTQLTSRTATY